jgi:DNA-directed RNA polymerase specialized sigma24 family protein
MSTGDFVVNPDIVGAVTRYGARNGVFEQDLADYVAEVQTRAIEHVEANGAPKDAAGWEGMMIRIARNYLCDRCDKRKTAKKWNAGLCEAPDDFVPLGAGEGEEKDPVDRRRQLTVLLEMFERGEMPEQGREILEGVADGMKAPAIGAELGLPAKEVRRRLTVMRRSYFKRLHVLGLMVLVIVLFAVHVRVGGPPEVSQPAPGEVDAGTDATPEDAAARIREEALRACDEGKWEECEERLDRAREMDPAGEEAPEVRRARERLERVDRARE